MTVSILLLHSFDLQLQFYCINSLLYNISILAGGGSGDTWLLMQQVIFSWFYKRQRNQRLNCQHPLDHRKSKRVPEKHDCIELLHLWLQRI